MRDDAQLRLDDDCTVAVFPCKFLVYEEGFWTVAVFFLKMIFYFITAEED